MINSFDVYCNTYYLNTQGIKIVVSLHYIITVNVNQPMRALGRKNRWRNAHQHAKTQTDANFLFTERDGKPDIVIGKKPRVQIAQKDGRMITMTSFL